MTLPFACHVFAHKEGRYQTVAAYGTDVGETKALEQFFFGQTNDPAYLRTLAAEPGIIWRRIGARVALTRVTQGPKDSNRRPTFKFETLLDAGPTTPLIRNVVEVVLGEWQVTDAGAKVTPSSGGETLPLNPAGISQVVLAARDGKRVLHPAKAFSLRDVAAMIESCAEEPGFSLCFKSFNERAPVLVNLLSRNISERTMSTTPPEKRKTLPRTQNPVHEYPPRRASNPLILLAVCAVLIIQVFMLMRGPGVSSTGSPSSDMQDAIIAQMKQHHKDLVSDVKNNENSLSKQIRDLKEENSEYRTASKKELDDLRNDIDGIDKRMKAQDDYLVKHLGTKVGDDFESVVERLDRLKSTSEFIKGDLGKILDKQNAMENRVSEIERIVNKIAKILLEPPPTPKDDGGDSDTKKQSGDGR